jgi:hypothetical protein
MRKKFGPIQNGRISFLAKNICDFKGLWAVNLIIWRYTHKDYQGDWLWLLHSIPFERTLLFMNCRVRNEIWDWGGSCAYYQHPPVLHPYQPNRLARPHLPPICKIQTDTQDPDFQYPMQIPTVKILPITIYNYERNWQKQTSDSWSAP